MWLQLNSRNTEIVSIPAHVPSKGYQRAVVAANRRKTVFRDSTVDPASLSSKRAAGRGDVATWLKEKGAAFQLPCATGAMRTVRANCAWRICPQASTSTRRLQMAMRTRGFCMLFAAIAATSACNGETMLPDTLVRAPGSILHDGGFGLGSGGFTSPPSNGGVSTTNTTCVPGGGFGLGSGGKEDPCSTSPTL